jgi:hypothetical protein
MNTEPFRKQLRDKERELQSNIARLEGEARVSGKAAVGDSTDAATSSQGTSESSKKRPWPRRHWNECRTPYSVSKTAPMAGASSADARLKQPAWKLVPGRQLAWRIRRGRTKRHTCSKAVRPFDTQASPWNGGDHGRKEGGQDNVIDAEFIAVGR